MRRHISTNCLLKKLKKKKTPPTSKIQYKEKRSEILEEEKQHGREERITSLACRHNSFKRGTVLDVGNFLVPLFYY